MTTNDGGCFFSYDLVGGQFPPQLASEGGWQGTPDRSESRKEPLVNKGR